jgi:hypothetical protein
VQVIDASSGERDLQSLRNRLSQGTEAAVKRKGRRARRRARSVARKAVECVNDPAMLVRQGRAYDLRVLGFSYAQIAQNCGCSVPTAVGDVRIEAARRTAAANIARDDRRELLAAGFRKVLSACFVRVDEYRQVMADPELQARGRAALGQVVTREAAVIIRCFEALGKLDGLLAAHEEPSRENPIRQFELDVFDAMSEAQRLAIRLAARERRESYAMKQVGP